MSDDKSYTALTESTYYILLALYTPLHGYGIMQRVQKLTNNRITLAPGTLYGAIRTLLEKDWIRLHPSHTDNRKKEYQLTNTGQKVLRFEIKRLEELYHNGLKVVKED